MENITSDSRMVKTVLRTTLRVALKSLPGTTQDAPSHTVALAKQTVELFIAGFSAQMLTEVHRRARPVPSTPTASNF